MILLILLLNWCYKECIHSICIFKDWVRADRVREKKLLNIMQLPFLPEKRLRLDVKQNLKSN